MHSTGSIIKTYIEKVRHYLDDPDVEAKYDDNYLVRFFLSSSMTDVISRVSMMSDNQILCRFTLQVTAGTERYKLPPVVRQVLRLGPLEDETKLYTEDFRPRNELSLFGPGWALEGNEIAFRPVPSENKEYVVLYVPSGDIACHYGTGTLNANGTFTMGATPTIGSLDKRPGAYIGSYLRILGANVVDEVLISAHDTVTRVLSTRIAATNAAGTYTYEIVPFLMEPMVDAISLSAAMRAGVGRKVTQAQMQSMAFAYKQAIKTAYDTIGNMNSRAGKRFTGIIDTYGTISTAFPGGSSSGGGGGGTIPTCLPPCEPAEDDVSGTWPNLTVEAIQGNPVSTDAPADGEVLTWDSTAGAWVPEPIPPQSGGEFRWYVSQSQGLDTNDGLTPATAFKTLAKVMTVAQPYDEILLKCGDRWREQINAPTMDNLTISSYGAGPKPIIDGSDVITLGSGGWAESYDVTDDYYYTTGSISAAVSAYSYSTYGGLIHVGVYIDGVQLAQQTASSVPGSLIATGFYVATTGSPNYTPTGYVDFTSFDGSSLVGKTIEISVRPYAIRLRDNCTVKGIRTTRNAHNDGSLVLGFNAHIEDCDCDDGTKHNCFVASGYLKRVRCSMANRRGPNEPGMEAGTLFVAFNQDPSSLKVTWDECSVYGARADEFQFGLTAFFAHGVGNPYGTMVVKNCFVENVNTTVGGDWVNLLVADTRAVNAGNLVFGGSTLAGSKTIIVSSVLHTAAFMGDRVIQAKTRLVKMRGCEIIASHLNDRFIVDTEDDTATAYDLQYCTFVEDSRTSPTALGIIRTRNQQSLKMSNCALFQSDESPADVEAATTPVVKIDNPGGGNHSASFTFSNLYHAGFKQLIRNNYYEGTPRRIRFDRGGTILISQDIPSGNANTSALWITEVGSTVSTMEGSGVNGPVLPYSTRLPYDTGRGPNVSFVGLADAQLPSHGEWISYPKSSWVALNAGGVNRIHGAWQWSNTQEKAELMSGFGVLP